MDREQLITSIRGGDPDAIIELVDRLIDVESGGGSLPFIVVGRAAADFNIKSAGVHLISFDVAYDNVYDYNVITELPDGLGLDMKIDGSSPDITTLEAGTWLYTLTCVPDPDGTFMGSLGASGAGVGNGALPLNPTHAIQCGYTEVLPLPAGAVFRLRVLTGVAATAGSFPIQPVAAIKRLD